MTDTVSEGYTRITLRGGDMDGIVMGTNQPGKDIQATTTGPDGGRVKVLYRPSSTDAGVWEMHTA